MYIVGTCFYYILPLLFDYGTNLLNLLVLFCIFAKNNSIMSDFVGPNLKYLRKKLGLTQDQLAVHTGINRPAIGSYEEGRASPKISMLQLLAKYYRITIDQLINVDLSNRGLADNILNGNGDSIRILTTVVDRDNRELILVVPAKASAGYLNGYADPEYIDSLPHFTLPFPEIAKERSYRAFQIRGDSMDPIPSGAYIIGEYLTDWHHVKDGKTYVLVTRDEGIVYKRVFMHPSGELWLKSDNPIYEPYTIHTSRLLEIWKAVGIISTLLPEPDAPTLNKLSVMMQEMKKEIEELKVNH
jgi:transcriptional regulator with XRE-family HTH domain